MAAAVASNLTYCPPNITLSVIWINHGVSKCFLDTITASVTLGFILILGITQLFFYKKYATPVVNTQQKFWFKLQVFAHVFLVVLAIANFIMISVLPERQIYGFEILYLIAAVITWPLCLAVLMVERHYQLPTPPSHGHGFVLLTSWSASFIVQNLAFLSMDNEDWWFNLTSAENKLEFGFWVLRYVFTFVVFLTGMKAPGILTPADFSRETDREALLGEDASAPGARGRRSASQGSTWANFFKKIRILMPYMWPKKSITLQFYVIFSMVLLVAVRVTNVYVPILSKQIVDDLAGHGMDKVTFVWGLILIFVTMRLIQGGGNGQTGVLNIIRSILWIRVQQYTEREIQVSLFGHLHRLSLRWHLSRKTGEVLRIMDRGKDSINGLLNYIMFSILPTIIDIIIAIIYFTVEFNVLFGLIVFITMAVYLVGTITVTEWRTKFRRRMNEAENKQRTRAVDSLLNFETVKYYGAEQLEVDRYDEAILNFQKQEYVSVATLNFLNLVQTLVINAGFLAGSLYCGYLVAENEKSVGDYVLFGTYIMQLMVPLNWLGTLYRMIQESFINMENMLDLMDEPIEIQDGPHALPLIATKGKIEFRNVNFSYVPERPIIKDLSFTVESGETYAIVGPTGAGKSTIMRLLFRFYDVNGGAVLIDDQNIKDVTQVSLRQAIGVVPQDTVLFNDTIGANIMYARPEASIEEVMKTAALAEIHGQITQFPEGYDTVVGERGLKLSGGEKQRVAIARTLLKSPLVVLLDEATSALDTQTERNIQDALNIVCANRTTVIIAHRLSTITHANCILVLKDGEVVERGRHEELLSNEDGVYANMWKQQSQVNNGNNQAEDEISKAD